MWTCEESASPQLNWALGKAIRPAVMVSGLWRKPVKLYQTDRFAREPDKLATCEKLPAAINPECFRGQSRAESGRQQNTARNRRRPGRLHPAAGLDGSGFQRRGGTGRVAAAHESLQQEIIAVIESLEQLKESAESELCGIVEQRPGALDELAAEQSRGLEQESTELQPPAEKLADETRELNGQTSIH